MVHQLGVGGLPEEIIIVKQDFKNMNKSSCSGDPLNEEEKENLTDQSEKSHRYFFSACPKKFVSLVQNWSEVIKSQI